MSGVTPIFGGQAASPPPSQPTPPPAAPHPAVQSGGTPIFGGQTTAAPKPAFPTSGPAFNTLAQHNQSIFGDIPQETGQVASGASKVLDAQGWLARRAITGESDTDKQMTAIRHKIPGMDAAYNSDIAHTGIKPLDWIQSVGNQAGRGLIDAGIQTALDPLTYETLGFGAVAKSMGAPALRLYMKAVNSTPFTRGVYDALHFGGPVARSLGPEKLDMIRGAANSAEATGAAVERHMSHRFDNIVNGVPIKNLKTGKITPGVALTDDEKKQVARALNGDEDPDAPMAARENLTPREQSAYRQLRTLTALDFHFRQQTALDQAIRYNAPPQFRDELKQLFHSGKDPEIPEPAERVKVPYGEPQPRSRMINAELPPNEMTLYQEATSRMTTPEKIRFSKALTDNAIFNALPPELQKQAQAVKDAIHAKFSPPGMVGDTQELEPAQRAHFPPANQAAIDHATELKKLHTKIAAALEDNLYFRENYLPSAHVGEKTEAREAQTLNPTDYFDPRNVHRNEIKVTNPQQLQQGFEAMARNTNRQVTNKAISDSLGDLLDKPEVSKLFDKVIPATGDARTDNERWRDGWLTAVGYPRAATVSLTPRHAANILDLLANTVPPTQLPTAMKQVTELAAKLIKATPKEYNALTKDGRVLGSIGGGFREKQPFFQRFPDWKALGPLAGKGTGPLGAWTRMNNKLVWAVDEAAKQVYGKMISESGEAEGFRAGGLASQRLVDYAHLSPLQNALRYVAPFGTFRGGVPGAVAGGVARMPARAAFYNRLSGNTMYGSKPQPGSSGWQQYNPTADVGRGLGAPNEFAQATLGAPASAVIGATADTLFPRKFSPWENPVAYGQSWLPKRLSNGQLDLGFVASSALAGVPEAETLLESIGISRFKWKGLANEAMRQTLGVQHLSASP